MKILVTGASGFLGGHLARRLAYSKFDVIALGRNRIPSPPEDPKAAARFQAVIGKLEREDLVLEVDAVVHAAATSPSDGVSMQDIVRDNVEATQRLLEAAYRAKVRRFVFCSSLSAYGQIQDAVVNEQTPSRSVDAYGLTKLLGERMIEEMIPGAASLSIRLPAVVGSGAARHWLATTLAKLRAGTPVAYFNAEQRFNNLIHEADLERTVRQFLREDRDPGHDAIVVGSAGFMTVENIVSRLVSMTGSRSSVSCEGARPGSFTIDFSKAVRDYGFSPFETPSALKQYLEEELGSDYERH